MAQLSASISLETTDSPVFDQYLSLYGRLGCQGLQGIWRNPIELDLKNVLQRVARAGLSFDSVHGTFGDDFDVSTPDESIRLQTILTHEQDAELAAALGGALVVIHPACVIPKTAGLEWASRYDRSVEGVATKGWGAAVDQLRAPLLIDSIEKLAAIGEEMGIIFAIENIPGYLWYGNNAPNLATMIRSIESPHLRMCFDTGHAKLEARQYGTVADQLSTCLDVVSYVHVHDNDGTHDSHLVPGHPEGIIDWDAVRDVIRNADDNLIWMLELFGTAAELDHWFNADQAVQDQLNRLFDLG